MQLPIIQSKKNGIKTILAPTDFSEAAENAVNYAIEMAKFAGAKVILFHAFNIPFVEPGAAALMAPIGQLEKAVLSDLEMIAHQLRIVHDNDVVIECKCSCGFAVDEISQFVDHNSVDLIVMGMQGNGYLTDRLSGSVTTRLLQKIKCPVLTISENVKFKMVKRIALASELDRSIGRLAPLRKMAQMFDAHIYIINVVEDLVAVPSNPLEITDFGNVPDRLRGIEHSFHFCEGENVLAGINDFIIQNNIDIVVMIPGKHSWLERLLHEPNTKKMAFHAEIPMLVLN
jgi:nucleotide-binding universal stress UspA family protein